MSKSCILVLGMHRSGTSVLTHALSLAGFHLGNELIEVGPDNPSGFWENLSIVKAHERLLSALGTSWDDPSPLQRGWLESKATHEAKAEIMEILSSEFSKSPAMAIKDPRLCRLLPLWLPILKKTGWTPTALMILRHPAEISASLQARDGMSAKHAQWLWASYMASAWLESEGVNRTFVSYGQFVRTPEAVLCKALEDVGVPLPGSVGGIHAIVNPSLRHHREQKEKIEPFASALWNVLESGAERSVIDEASKGFLRCDIPLEVVSAVGAYFLQKAIGARSEAKKNAENAKNLHAAMLEASRFGQEREIALNRAKQWMAERDAVLDAQRVRIEALENEIREAARQIEGRDISLSEAARFGEEREAALEQAKIWMSEREEALNLQRARIRDLEAEIHEAARQIDLRDISLEEASRYGQEREAALAHAKAWMEEREQSLSAQRARISALEAEVQRGAECINRKDAELQELTALTREREAEIEGWLSRLPPLEEKVRHMESNITNCESSLKQMDNHAQEVKDMLLAGLQEHAKVTRAIEELESAVQVVKGMRDADAIEKIAQENNNRLILDGLQNQINILRAWVEERERRRYLHRALMWCGVASKSVMLHAKISLKRGIKAACLAVPGSPNKKESRLAYLRGLSQARNGVNHVAILGDVEALACRRWPATPAYVIRGRSLEQESPAVDVSVVLFNSAKWVGGFLDSLRQSDYPTASIRLFFRDHSPDSTTEVAINEWVANNPEIKFAELHYSRGTNVGFGAGHNYNFALGSAELFLVANVDGKFAENALRTAVLAAVNSEQDVGAWELRQAPYEHPKYYDPITMETSWFSGACVLFSRTAFRRAGGFDDAIFMYGEDVELSYRMRGKGIRLAYVPNAIFMHDTYEEANAFKPLQFHGSTLANLLLRMRYGSLRDFVGIPAMLVELYRAARAAGEISGFRRNLFALMSKAPLFFISRLWSPSIHIPFNRWDYGLRRDGAFERVHPYPENARLPLVSIIVRTYKGRESLLEQALCSIANQTYPAIEAVVIEDKGTDLANVAMACSQRWGLPVRFEGVSSPESNRCVTGNRGLQLSTGRFLNFLDDDDALFADHVEYLVSRFEESGGQYVAHYALSWQVSISWDAERRRYSEQLHQTPDGFRREFDADVLSKFNYMPIQAVMFDRRLYERFGGLNVGLENLEDWEMWRRYSLGGAFKLGPKTTSLFHIPACVETLLERQKKLDDYYHLANEIALQEIAMHTKGGE